MLALTLHLGGLDIQTSSFYSNVLCYHIRLMTVLYNDA